MTKRLIIFDLDETLVHARKEPLAVRHVMEVAPYFIYARPFHADLLSFCARHFDLAVWSSSSGEYVKLVSDHLFKDKYPLKFAWSTEKCVQREDPQSNSYVYIKDLRKVQSQGYAVEQVLIVDDSPEKLRRQPRNLIRVRPFHGETDDTELLRVVDELKGRLV